MHNVEDILVEKNYSKCPLKKRPVNYQFDDCNLTLNAKMDVASHIKEMKLSEQPENLSLKKESCSTIIPHDEELINVSDSCEDEGVDVDHIDDDEIDDEDDEMIDCVDIEENNDDANNTTQAAALAAAAAMAAASAAAVVVPKPTYPNYIPPWNFHMSPYTAEFYRTIGGTHLAQQISPLRGDLLSPSSPSDSIGSLSPPPHYLHGRANSVSPPMRSEIIHRPIGVRHMPQSPQQQHQQHQHRYMPYALPAYHPPAYPLGYHHHAPISPAYSDSSYYSMRSVTPESNCSSVPEDLSIKHTMLQKVCPPRVPKMEVLEKNNNNSNGINNSTLTATTATSNPLSSTTSATGSSIKKEKSSPPRYQCPDCQKSYSTFSGLTKHQQFHCPAAEGNQVKKSFSCKDCDKTYVSLGALKMHIRTHTLPCKCNICGKAFSRPWLLQGHIRTHTGEKPFSCQHCHRAFADRSNLRAHLQTHSDIKKYSCTNCSKTFSRMSLLTKHSEGGCPGGNSGNGGSSGMGITPNSNCSNSSSSCHSSASVPAHSAELSSYPIYAEH